MGNKEKQNLKRNKDFFKSKGRIDVWLEEEDIDFIIKEWEEMKEHLSDFQAERWGNIAYRCNIALFANTEQTD